MQRKMNKKGFTIVELVIVIAVIAILAAVMIPTFSGIVNKAKESAALQEATNTYKALLTEDSVTLTAAEGATAEVYTVKGNTNFASSGADLYIVVDNVVFEVVDGEIAKSSATIPVTGYTALTTTGYTNVYVYDAE